MKNFELDEKIHIHQKLDLSVLHLKRENEFVYHSKDSIYPVNVSADYYQPELNSRIDFVGFQNLNQELNQQKPSMTFGNVNLIHKDRIYAKTNDILDHGERCLKIQ
jgi:hypothetical protein